MFYGGKDSQNKFGATNMNRSLSRADSQERKVITLKDASRSTRNKRAKRQKSKEFRVINKTWDGLQNSNREESEVYSNESPPKKGYIIKRGDSNPKKTMKQNPDEFKDFTYQIKLNMGNGKVSQTYDHRNENITEPQSRVPSHQILRKSRKF